MSLIQTFLLGLVLCFGLCATVLLSLRTNLHRVLAEIAASPGRGAFWATFSLLVVLLLGVFGGTTTWGYPSENTRETIELFFGLITQVRFTLLGLLFSVIGVAMLVLLLIRVHEACERDSRRRAQAEAAGHEG